VTVLPQARNSLNNRFHPSLPIRTRSVLIADDDVLATEQQIRAALAVHRKHPSVSAINLAGWFIPWIFSHCGVLLLAGADLVRRPRRPVPQRAAALGVRLQGSSPLLLYF
jgi:hypothetical protein